jgi:hypothetical protein
LRKICGVESTSDENLYVICIVMLNSQVIGGENDMKKLRALLIKFVLNFIAAWFIFGFIGNNPILWVLVTSLAVTILNFVIGDLIVLPKFGNLVASLGDGILAGLTALVLDLLLPNFCTTLITLPFYIVLISIVEYFFHIYLMSTNVICRK